MTEENHRLRKRLQIEATVIRLSGFGALLFSARILYHAVNRVLVSLLHMIP